MNGTEDTIWAFGDSSEPLKPRQGTEAKGNGSPKEEEEEEVEEENARRSKKQEEIIFEEGFEIEVTPLPEKNVGRWDDSSAPLHIN